MNYLPPHTVDFETLPIQRRPEYPPAPVGVSIIPARGRVEYLAWGHPEENNCTKAQAAKKLKQLWDSNHPILFHNADFDLEVASHLGLTYRPKGGVHDTMLQAFIYDPREPALELKVLAEKYCGMKPEERDLLGEWVRENIRTEFPTGKGHGGEVRRVCDDPANKKWGHKVAPSKVIAYTAYAPGKLAGKYANGDTVRTLRLHKFYLPKLKKFDMLEAYERELQVLDVLLTNEQEGVPIHTRNLRRDVTRWENNIEIIDTWLRSRTKVKTLDVDKPDQLADALEYAGFIDEWQYTPTGKRSVSKDSIMSGLNNAHVAGALQYRRALIYSLRNFGRPWLRMAEASGGNIYTNWNQVVSTDATGKKSAGARTGRLSSNPNFQNIPKQPDAVVSRKTKAPHILLPKPLLDKVGQLPAMRGYIVPEKGGVLLGRDYSQQELRILAHYEDGELLTRYVQNPLMDVHATVKELIYEMLYKDYPRGDVKTTVFGMIYGMGDPGLAEKLGCSLQEAKELRAAVLEVLPGLKTLSDDLKNKGKAGEPIHTWGWRRYFVEEPKFNAKYGRMQTFEYKLLNVLIQGSAADCTKQAIINYDRAREHGRLLLTVHDEILITCPKEHRKTEMALLRDAMADVDFEVDMLSDGKWSAKNWAEMKEFKE